MEDAVPTSYDPVGTDDPARLWGSVLARQPNVLARMALVPDDPTLS